MIEGLKPYPAYRATGDRWLTHFPSAWERVRIKYLLREIDRRTQTGEEPLLSMRRDHGLVPLSQFSDKVAEPKALLAYKLVEPGELVVNRMQAGNGLVFVARIPGLISPDYAIFRPVREVNLDYLELLFRSYPMRAKFWSESTGLGTGTAGFLRLYGASLGAIEIGLPSPDEQSQIVRFLDHADRRIRLYSRAKKKLVALLNEQRRAIIHSALTRGLDSSGPRRATGNSWFPEIPEAWELLSMRRTVWRAVDGPHHSPQYVDHGVPFISARNIKQDRWSLNDAKFISEDDYREFSKRIVPERGDVLYTKGGTTGVARVVDLDFRFQVWVHVAVLKLRRDKILPAYLAMVLNTVRCYEQSQLFTRGATNQDLGLNRMKDIVLPVPPLSEQETLVASVTELSKGFVHAVNRAEREIELLRECRTRLIADVVTGKADVREAAANLQDVSTIPEEEQLAVEDASECDAAELNDAEAEVGA
jgi:type I restriction enzyme, S subunit